MTETMFLFNKANKLKIKYLWLCICLLSIVGINLTNNAYAQETKPVHRRTPPKNSRDRQNDLLRTPTKKESSTDRQQRQTYAEGVQRKSLPKNKAAKTLTQPTKIIDRKRMASATDLVQPQPVREATKLQATTITQKVRIKKKTPLSTDLINPVLASNKKGFEGTSYSGDYEAPKAKTNPQSSYRGKISMASLERKQRKIKRAENERAEYSGNLSLRNIQKKKRRSESIREQMASFSGDMVVTNTPAVKRKRAKQIANFKGVLIKQKPPRAKYKTINFASPTRNRPANYNRNRLKAGAKLKKSEVANYQKEKNKIGYDSREADFWRTGGSLKDKGFQPPKREKPKPVKKKKKGKSTGEDQEEMEKTE